MSDPRLLRRWAPAHPLLVGCFITGGIAILAAVLFPVFAQHHHPQGSRSTCMSNIKQIMLATQMYAADHDQHLPSALDWPQALLPIVKNAQVYICDNDDSSGFPAGGDMRSSYTMSKALSGVDPRFIRDPGQVGVLFDGNALFGGTSVAAFRHNDGLHVGFADGHVKWVSQGNFAQVPLSPAAAGQPRPGP